MFRKTEASKEQVKLMIGLTGPAGSGKTFSALQLAHGIMGDWKKIALCDTENRSALYYAGASTGPWQHIDFAANLKEGYSPNNWVKLIEFAESDPNIEILILDSISHEWQGTGGCLQLVQAYSKNAKGNTFTPWNEVTPLHNKFIDKMRNSRLHIIATLRANTEYALEKNEYGKTLPRKIGMKPIQRDGIEYEFGVMFDIDISHYATSSKDRTNLFADRPPFIINGDIGKQLVEWSKDGEKQTHSREGIEIFSKEKDTHMDSLKKLLIGEDLEHLTPIIADYMNGKNKTLDIMRQGIKHAQLLIEVQEHAALDEI